MLTLFLVNTNMGKQLAAAISKYNDKDPSASIQVIHKDVSELKEGEVLVRMMLRPINPSDMFCMRGRQPIRHVLHARQVRGIYTQAAAGSSRTRRSDIGRHAHLLQLAQLQMARKDKSHSSIFQAPKAIIALTVRRSDHKSY